MPEAQNQMAMPRYKCHMEVCALKIAEVLEGPSGGLLMPTDKQYAPIFVSCDYVRKHTPFAGGYYVVFQDGYKSFWSARAFEEGFRLAEETQGKESTCR